MGKQSDETSPVPVTILMSERDFERLTTTSTQWADSMDSWGAQIESGRFENMMTDGLDNTAQRHWKMAHWLDDRWSDVLMATAFLRGRGEDYEILWDLADDYGYVILTNYVDLSWQRINAKSAG